MSPLWLLPIVIVVAGAVGTAFVRRENRSLVLAATIVLACASVPLILSRT